MSKIRSHETNIQKHVYRHEMKMRLFKNVFWEKNRNFRCDSGWLKICLIQGLLSLRSVIPKQEI